MTNLNHSHFDQLMRGAIGFDRLTEMLGQTLNAEAQNAGYPPYNIEKTDEDAYRVTLAVAGFTEDEIEIEQRENALFISGTQAETEGERSFLHRGIANRSFRRRFQLADHVKVLGASLKDGLLHVDLQREIPEERRPRKIEITKLQSTPEVIKDSSKKEKKTATKAA